MKSCLRIPRVFLPEEGFDKWAVIACDQFPSDRGYWEHVAHYVGEAPSTLRCILPEVYLPEAGEETYDKIRESMYEVLENGTIDKLNRGFLFVKRSTTTGVRKGIVVSVDLEQYSSERGETSPVRSSEEIEPSRLPPLVALRRNAPLEFSRTMLFYRDKHDKLNRALEDEDLEKLYDFELMEGGGHVSAYFIPEDLSEEVIHMLRSRTEPCFAVADGHSELAAAKAYWEEIKPSLKEEERRNHPARFTLAELVNLYDSSVVFKPVHRLIKETDAEAFCDFFMKNIPCKREGKVLIPTLSDAAACIRKTDEILAQYGKANGGTVDYIQGEEELRALAKGEDCAGVVVKTLAKEDLFSALKGGRNLPKKCFSVGEPRDKRYYVECKEIGYD